MSSSTIVNTDIKKTSEKNNDKHKETSAVFIIKPRNKSNECQIKFRGVLKSSEKLGDEIVELDKPLHPDHVIVGKHAIPLKNIGSFEMIGRLYRCNIVGSHIVACRRYPIMYLNIHYDKPMVSGSLFQLFFSIDMDREQKKSIKNNREYINLRFTGKWVRHIDVDDELKENFDNLLVDMLEKEGSELFYNSEKQEYVKLRELLKEDEVLNWIEKYVNKERKYYDELMEDKSVEFISVLKTRDYFLELCQTEKFHKFLGLAMKCREIQRRKDNGLSDDEVIYTVPEKVTKLEDIKKEMIDNDELILDDVD